MYNENSNIDKVYDSQPNINFETLNPENNIGLSETEIVTYNFDIKSIVLNERNLELYDAVILATDHDDFDLDLIQRKSKILIDTRGVCDKTLNNVVRL